MIVKGKKTKMSERWNKLMSDLKPMTWKQRIDHLWTYYKEWVWIAAVVIIVMIGIISSFIQAGKDVVVTGMLVNISITQEGHNYLQEDYFAHVGADEKNDIVRLEYTNFESLADPTNNENNYYSAMALIAEVSATTLDYIIQDELALEFYIYQDVYMDLEEFFTPEEIEALAGKLIYAEEEDSDDPWLMAIDITDLPFVQDNITSDGKVYFSLSGSTTRPEACRDIWEYINNWESPAE